MKFRPAFLLLLTLTVAVSGGLVGDERPTGKKKVYILPIRDDIMPPMVYLVRRGVKEAMDADADLLVMDMETNGGRFDTTKEVIGILDQFKGQTVTYVNRDAYSAGAFIAVATQKIFMAPQGVIGAAAPILLGPGGTGVEKMPDTVEAKMTSAVAARVRASAEKNGHNKEVVEAMINKTKELVIDGEVLNKEGQILTLTNVEAEKEYGNPPKPLLSSGTVKDIDELLEKLGYPNAARVYVKPTGAEKLASWINAISPLLLLIGIVGVYIEFKTPGFGLPGIVGIIAFALYFLGGYVAGLSGMEWIAVFVLGVVMVALELFLFPGTIVVGLIGAALMLIAVVMAMVDVYPGMPTLPSIQSLRLPLKDILIAFVGAALAIGVLSRVLPKTSVYHKLVSQSASGVNTVAELEQQQASRVGQVGIALSALRPGGKAQFGDQIIDVISQGEMVAKGQRVKIIGHSGTEAIVEAVG
jgi:membrane-bound serine protease (ClpP class)